MLKEALQYIVGLSEAREHSIHGDVYSDKPLHRIDTYCPKADSVTVHTLTSLLDYINGTSDILADKMIVAVESPTTVRLYSELDCNRDREYLMVAEAFLPKFYFNQFIDQESFCINLQSKFIQNQDRDLLLKFAGTVESGTVAQYGDDGVTQKATIKTGLASKGEAILPNPVRLKPFRTFLEIDQPESDFIFRMREGRGVECAIYEADGGAWQIEAMQKIKAYLQEALKDMPHFTVIA